MDTLPVVQERHGSALTVTELKNQLTLIHEAMGEVMQPGVDYGYIPGTEPKNEAEKKFKKPALFQAGAEKLCVLFRLGQEYDIIRDQLDGDHLTITSKCTLTHIPTGNKVGSALGSCSTMESKYAYRKGTRLCPECSAPAIIKGKEEYGGGWLCFRNKGGCGAKFKDGDEAIEGQGVGKIANEDKADQYNTVLKMANKRAFTSAVKGATAASAIFSVDIVDEDDLNTGDGEKKGKQQRAPREPKAKAKDTPPGPTTPGSINATQASIVRKTLGRSGKSEADLCKAFSIEKLEDLPAARINEAIDAAKGE